METTDQALVSRARAGDRSAFHELLDRHADYLFRVAMSLVGNAADAEDVVQETVLAALRGLRRFEGRSAVRTWLTAILVRQTASGRRRARRRMAASLQSISESANGLGVACPADAADARMDVRAAIQDLSPEYRQVVVLRELHGLTYDEMAEVLGVPRGTVESRLFRARRQLQERLKEYLA